MRIGFLFENEGERLLEEFKKREDIEINILASSNCYINNKKVDIINLFKTDNINIYRANIPFVKLLISDSREMMHTYTKFSENKREVIPQTAIGIWNKYEDIAKNYNERFMNQLKKIKNKYV